MQDQKAGPQRGVKQQDVNGTVNIMKKQKKIKACWSGYEAIGFKKKGGKRVPNCVPKKKKK